jgi:hypothetical protein
MLNLIGELNEDEIAEAARKYLPTYGKKEKETSEVPFKHNGRKKFAVFYWLAKQWVYIKVQH